MALTRNANRLTGACLATLLISASSAALSAPKVVASIAPIHSITAAIMQGVAEPDLLVEQSASPHNTTLRPSKAQALQDADLVVWVGPGLEPFLVKPIENLSGDAQTLELSEAPELTLLPVREGANWEKHSHDEHEHDAHDHDEHEEHDHDAHDHDDHDHDAHEHEDHDHDAHDHEHDDDHDHQDMHVWMDPDNGIAIASAVTKALSTMDPDNAAQYEANRDALIDTLKTVESEAETTLADVKDKPFIVFHDAYHYLEDRIGLNAVGSVTLHPGVAPGAARVSEIQEKLRALGAACIFAEPQFSSSLLPVLTEGTETRFGQLDPIGVNLTVGPSLYPELIRYNVNQLRDCLSGS